MKQAIETEPGKPAVWTVSVSRLTRLFSDVIPEFDGRARIAQLNLGFEEAVERIEARLLREPCDVIVAGGSNGAYLRGRVDVPVVTVTATGFDLLEALARARKIGPRIGVVTHAADVPSFESFRSSFGLAIEHRSFVTVEDARDRVAELAATGVDVVVGTGMAIDLAEQAGLPGVLLYSVASVRAAFERAIELARTAARLPPVAVPRARVPNLTLHGRSEAMETLRAGIAAYGPHDATVLVEGETGTGKEVIARNLHAASGRRGRFVAVNCGALSESLLEAELFGYVEGAFTGARRGGRIGLVEAAHGGTLFLDEIAELPVSLQTRLLRVLEEHEVQRVGSTTPIAVDVRVVAASLQDLPALVDDGQFRRDLYYRLAVLRLRAPSLAERPEDVAILVDHFLGPRKPRPRLKPEALALLRAYAWPGNVRELRNVVERIAVHWAMRPASGAIEPAELRGWVPELAEPLPPGGPVDKAKLRELVARGESRNALRKSLGVSRTTLWRWMRDT